jgi:hypothetical protein
MDAIRFLKEEHQKAKAAFGKIDGAPPDQRGELWRQLEPELKAHEQIEEQCFYRPLARDAQGKDSLLARWPERHQGDVREVEESLGEIDPLDPPRVGLARARAEGREDAREAHSGGGGRDLAASRPGVEPGATRTVWPGNGADEGQEAAPRGLTSGLPPRRADALGLGGAGAWGGRRLRASSLKPTKAPNGRGGGGPSPWPRGARPP